MKQPNELNDQELQSEYKSLHHSINVIDCFNSKDILRMEILGQELEQRGFEITSDVQFEK